MIRCILQMNNQASQSPQKKQKSKSKNFKIVRRASSRRQQSREFTNPIYAGFEDEEMTDEQHNFGPWLRKEPLTNLTRDLKYKSQPKILNSKINIFKNNHIGESISESTLTLWRKYEQCNSPQINRRQKINNSHIKEPQIPSIKTVKYSSVDLGSIAKAHQILEDRKERLLYRERRDNMLLKRASEGKIKYAYHKKQMLGKNGIKKIKQQGMIVGRVVYNYCYDDQLLSLKLKEGLDEETDKVNILMKTLRFKEKKNFFNRQKLEVIRQRLK